ncbi:unnamed protein product [Parajaminaea phylloscopi]
MTAADDQDGDDEDDEVLLHQRQKSPYGTSLRAYNDVYRSGRDRDRDRSDRLASSYSRMGSVPPLSPRSMRASSDRDSPFGRSYGNRDRGISPAARLGQQTSPEPWISGAAPEEDDVELDLGGMDMKMDDIDESDHYRSPARAVKSPLGQAQTESSGLPPAPAPSPALAAVSPPTGSPIVHKAANALPTYPESHSRRSASASEITDQDNRGTGAVQPLRRVFQLLRDEAKPVESEVASEAKLTKRLTVLHEAAARGGREQSPFVECSPHVSSSRIEGGPTLARRRYANRHDDEASASANEEEGRYEDDLLENVGFDSDVTDSSSDDSDLAEPPTATTSCPQEYQAASDQLHRTAADVSQDGQNSSFIGDMQIDDDGDADMSGQTDRQSSSAASAPIPTPAVGNIFANLSSRTPPRRFQTPSGPSSTNVSPIMDRGQMGQGVRSPAPTTPLGMHASLTPLHALGAEWDNAGGHADTSSGTVATNASAGDGSGGNASYVSRKRTGSAWMSFRNSPSATTSGGSLEKRHHRLHGQSFRSKRTASNANLDHIAANRGLSTSPASAAGPAGISAAVAGGSSPRFKNSVTSASANLSHGVAPGRSGLLTKRKYGFASDSPSSDGGGSGGGGGANSGSGGGSGNERFEPYANSVYKRRAVSPLSTINLSLYGHGGARGKARSPPLTPGPALASLGPTGLSSPSMIAASRRTHVVSQRPSYPGSSAPSPTLSTAVPAPYGHPSHPGYFPLVGGGSNGSTSGAGSSAASNGGSPLLLAAVAPRTVAGAASRPVTMTYAHGASAAAAAHRFHRTSDPSHRSLVTSTSTSTTNASPVDVHAGNSAIARDWQPSGSFAAAATGTSGMIPSFGEDGNGLGPSVVDGGGVHRRTTADQDGMSTAAIAMMRHTADVDKEAAPIGLGLEGATTAAAAAADGTDSSFMQFDEEQGGDVHLRNESSSPDPSHR